MVVKLSETERFYKNKKKIPKIILSVTEKHEIIYGARAINKQVVPRLRKTTTDYDIYTKTPKKDAKQLEKLLDKKFGGNSFDVKTALHKGTWKVNAIATGEGYADYTKPERKIPSNKIGKHNYATLSYIKRGIKKTLKDPEASFRHSKDRDALNRIKLQERLLKKKVKKKITKKKLVKVKKKKKITKSKVKRKRSKK